MPSPPRSTVPSASRGVGPGGGLAPCAAAADCCACADVAARAIDKVATERSRARSLWALGLMAIPRRCLVKRDDERPVLFAELIGAGIAAIVPGAEILEL